MTRVLSPEASPGAGAADGQRRSSRLAAQAVLLCYLLAALAVTWRLWADPAARTVAGNPGDADLFAWFMRYSATAVAHGQLPGLVTTTLNAPQGINVMWNTSILLPGVLLAPVTLLFGPQVSLTVLSTAGFAGSAASLFLVLRRWRISTGAAALAGAVYGFSPALVHASIGHYNLQLAILPPLIIDAGLRVAIGRPMAASSGEAGPSLAADLHDSAPEAAPPLPRPRLRPRLQPRPWARPRLPPTAPIPVQLRDGGILGLLVTAQMFTGEELLLITGLAGVLLVAGLAAGRPSAVLRRLRPAVSGLASAGLVTAGLAGWALWAQFAGPLTEHGSAFLADYFENDLTGFVTASRHLLFHTAASASTAARYQGGAPEYLAYLGWPLIAVLVAGILAFWRRAAVRATALTLAVLELLSLGGHPLIGGNSDPAVNLPWHWLEAIPVLGSALPARLSIVADGFAAALLAICVDLASARLSQAVRPGRARPAPGMRPAGAPADSDRGQASGSRLLTAGRTGAAALVLAVLASLPLLPRPLPAASAPRLPDGWSAACAALRLPAAARVLVVPVPTPTLTAAMRWQAGSGQPGTLIGGYFTGPASNGQAYVGGNGVTATARYLDQLWIAGLRPGAAGAPAATPAPVSAPAPAQLRADLAAWRPAAVLAVTTLRSSLGRYLVRLLGQPAIRVGAVLGWRL